MADTPPPSPPRLRRLEPRELLDDGEDVTRVTDRALVLRAVNSTLRTEQALGQLVREVSLLRLEVRGARAPESSESAGRHVRQPSIPEVAQALVDAVEEITDHGQHRPKTDSDPVRGVVKRVLDDAELEAARARRKRVLDVVQSAAGALAGAGLLEVARLIFLGHW